MSEVLIRSLAADRALSQIGRTEGRRNSNPWARELRSQGAPDNAPYCAIGVGWAYAPWLDWNDVFSLPWYVPTIDAEARRRGDITSRASDGLPVIYEFTGDSLEDHIGIAVPSLGNRKAAEFNTSPGSGGSQSNGDGVYLRSRSASDIRGYIDIDRVLRRMGKPVTSSYRGPLPTMVKGARGNFVKDIQRAIGAEPDGVFGLNTMSKVLTFQRRNGLTADGIVGSRTWAKAGEKAPARSLVRSKLRKGSRGSQVVEVQRIVKVKADGVFGPITHDAVKGFQRAKGLTADGVVGADTWSALLGAPVRVI